MDQAVVRESTTRLHYESVKRAIAAMRGQIGQPLSLRSLAKIGFASPYHFTRTFRSVTGCRRSIFFLHCVWMLPAPCFCTPAARSSIFVMTLAIAASELSPGDLPAPLACHRANFARLPNRRPAAPSIATTFSLNLRQNFRPVPAFQGM